MGRIKRTTRDVILRRDGPNCFWCDRVTVEHGHFVLPSRRPDQRTVDHFVCRSHGGRDRPANLVIACLECNQLRANMTAGDWKAMVDKRERAVAEALIAEARAGADVHRFTLSIRKQSPRVRCAVCGTLADCDVTFEPAAQRRPGTYCHAHAQHLGFTPGSPRRVFSFPSKVD